MHWSECRFWQEHSFSHRLCRDFLRSSENKRNVCPYLVELILKKYQFQDKIVAAKKNEKVITILEISLAKVKISGYSQSEAGSKIILHDSHCIQMDLFKVYVRINNTGVDVLLVAFIPDFLKINAGAQVIVICGVSTHKCCMSTNVIAESIALERCKELLFLHALSGSDYTSSFFHIRKVKFWNSWLVNQDVPKTFMRLGDWTSLSLREEEINVTERFITSLCYDDFNCFTTDLAWYEIFKHWKNMVSRFYGWQKMLWCRIILWF